MRKLFVMLGLLSMATFCTVAQSNDRTISFSAYSYVFGSVHEYGNIGWDKPIKCHYYIDVVLKRDRIIMISEDKFHDYLIIKRKNEVNDGGNERWLHFRCIDENDVRCDVHVMTVGLEHVRISFVYGDKGDECIYFYNCKRDDSLLDFYE